jgi:hypothetical protein
MALFSTIISFIHPWDAYIAKGRLEAEGIPVAMGDLHYIWMDWTHSLAWGGVKLRVLSDNEQRAKEIIMRHLRGEYEEALYEVYSDLEKTICPRCQSDNYRLAASYKSSVLSVLLTLWFSIVFPPGKKRCKCNECGYVWG